VNGRRIAVVSRDDGALPDTAVRAATRLATREKVHVLMGGFAANVSLALAQYAGRQKIVYVAAGPVADELTGAKGNRYTFRLRPSASLQAAMLLPEALRLRKRYWAIVYPHKGDYAAASTFKAMLMKAQPNVDFVLEQAIPLGKIDAAGLVLSLFDAQPDAVFSLLSGSDLREFVLAGNALRLFAHLDVLNLHAGDPESLELLKDAAPDGWWVTGYPWNDIDYYPHRRFLADYLKRWGEPPRAGSVVGYSALLSIAQAVRRANSSRTHKLIEGLEGLETLTPLGVVEWRKSDHQTTMGTFVGQLRNKGNEAVMVRWRFESASDHLPAE
jgi:branched-chain amino acid transport system substrate-binding protein